MALANRTLKECLYKDNPVRFPGSGTIEGLQKIRRDDLIEQKKNWHVPSNTIAIAVGNVNHRTFVKEVDKHIAFNFQKVPLKKWQDESDKPPLKENVVITRSNRQKAILVVGCKLPKNLSERKNEAFSMFSKFIGNSSKSRLWNEIRERRGLAYVVQGIYSGTAGLSNSFSVYIELDPTKYNQVKKVLWQSLLKPLSGKSDGKDFEEMKSRIVDVFEISATEHLSDYENLIWRNIVEDKPVKDVQQEEDRRLKIISRLSLKDLEEIRKEFIHPERFATVLIKPGSVRKG